MAQSATSRSEGPAASPLATAVSVYAPPAVLMLNPAYVANPVDARDVIAALPSVDDLYPQA